MIRGWLCLLVSVAALIVAGGTCLSTGHPADSLADQQRLAVRRVSSEVFSGPTPCGLAQFRQLSDRGVRTIVSVDGARPDVESAKSAGLDYIHIPIGYDGVPESAVAALTRVMQERPRPVYVHCHHGKHRGPAAAAVCAMIAGELDHVQAHAFLETVGTSHDYAGLWESVATFEPLPSGTPLPVLVSSAEVEPMVDAMLRIDEHFDRLVAAVEHGPVDRPAAIADGDVGTESIHVAALLHEDFREASRLLGADRPPAFIARLEAAEEQAAEIVTNLRGAPSSVPALVDGLRESCAACHREFRN